jgi:diphosphomevalonate decarboxylase
MKTARATAHSNIALVKYWGKRAGVDPDLNLPAVGSLSMTLDILRTITEVTAAEHDRFILDEETIDDEAARKVFRHLDRVWTHAGSSGTRPSCAVRSTNHLPTAAGLASSASGFAALTLAAAGAFGLDGDEPSVRAGLAQLARRGSGSAARSLWGGFVRLDRGQADDGSDCIARPLFGPDHWDLRLLVVHTARGSKKVGSTGGMERCRETSPYYRAWVDTSEGDLDAAQAALRERDLPRLGEVMEHSCFKMHACMLATQPPLMYWRGTTLDVIQEVWDARADGLEAYVTSDAGPHVKVLCEAVTADTLAARLRAVQGVHEVQSVAPGPDASLETAS